MKKVTYCYMVASMPLTHRLNVIFVFGCTVSDHNTQWPPKNKHKTNLWPPQPMATPVCCMVASMPLTRTQVDCYFVFPFLWQLHSHRWLPWLHSSCRDCREIQQCWKNVTICSSKKESTCSHLASWWCAVDRKVDCFALDITQGKHT